MKKYTGFTNKTPEKFLLGTGAFFKNFIVGTDTYEDAVTAGKLIGATAGGGSFAAIPNIRNIAIDGVSENTKGLVEIDECVVTLSLNLKELSKEAIAASLTNGKIVDAHAGYKKLTASNVILETDYLTNVVWVGKLSGSDKPVIIEVSNALAKNGLTLNTAEKNEAVVNTVFTGHYEADDNEEPPFAIYYPETAA